MANFQGLPVVLTLKETVGRKEKRNCLAKSPCPLGVSDGSAGQSAAVFSIPEVIWDVSVCERAHARVCMRPCVCTLSPTRPAHPQAPAFVQMCDFDVDTRLSKSVHLNAHTAILSGTLPPSNALL